MLVRGDEKDGGMLIGEEDDGGMLIREEEEEEGASRK